MATSVGTLCGRKDTGRRYDVLKVDAPLAAKDRAGLKQSILGLLNGFGEHFAEWFGRDLDIRLSRDGGVTTFLATLDGAACAHSSVYVNDDCPAVGALFNVFTAPEHRQQGLSRALVERTCDFFDSIGGQLMVLGTGSPFAAKTYQRLGFVHLNGGFDGGRKGYNPDDQGEWIMVRMSAQVKAALCKSPSPQTSTEFDCESFYGPICCETEAPEQILHWETFQRCHFAQVCLLLNADGGKFDRMDKLLCCNITDGLTAEENLIRLLVAVDEGRAAASVLIDRSVLPSHDLAVAIAVHWLSSREKRELTIDNSKQIKSDVDGVAQYIGSTGGFYSPRQRHSLDFMGQDDWLISFFSKSRQLDTSPPHGLSSEAGVQTHSSAVARFLEIWQSGACDSAARKEVEALLSSTPLGGRVLHGYEHMPGFGRLLSADEWKRLSWVFGPEAFPQFLGKTPREVCLMLGFGARWLKASLEKGKAFQLVLFPMDSVGATRADWDGVEHLLKIHYQHVWETAVECHFAHLRETPFQDIQAAAGYDMAEVNLAGRDPVSGESADPRYMSLQRLQKRISESTRPVTAIEVRQFLYDEIGLKKLFTGCGTTHNDDGNPGIPEYLAENRQLQDIQGCAVYKFEPATADALGSAHPPPSDSTS